MPAHRRARRLAAAVTAVALAAVGLLAPGVPEAGAQAAPPGERQVTAVLFQWRFDSVARACTESLGPAGYGYVQVSPPVETVQGGQWWVSYQPVGYRLGNRLGTRAEFAAMVSTCRGAGVRVIADVVVNHMTSGSGTGTAGSPYTKYDYPGTYQTQDFHGCRQDITDYRDRYQVQQCELLGLADLDTGAPYVQGRIAGYLDDLASLGVSGFRIDAAKHVAAADLAAIRARTADGAYWVQEVIHGDGEPVTPGEYTGVGDVHEFRWGTSLRRVLTEGRLAELRTIGEGWGFLPGGSAVPFVDNHDTERNGSTLSHERSGSDYTLAQVFTLAQPYGSPAVHSGYAFGTDYDAGPPNGGAVPACYTDGWTCQHAWPQINGMVGFRNAVGAAPQTLWWDDGADRIAFGRGSAGYLVINGSDAPLTRSFRTALPAGTYCDVVDGRPAGSSCAGAAVTVNADGWFTATVPPRDALAVHIGGRAG